VKSFFQRMSFPRVMILVCSLGSVAMGTLVYQRSKRLDEVKVELDKVKDLVKEIQVDAYRLDDLQRREGAEKFKAQDQPESYIRPLATHPYVDMGQLDFQKHKDNPARNVEDDIYKIVPQSKSQHYSRGQIGNFLYRLESDSPRVKVTRLKLTPFDKVNPGE